LRRPLGTAEEIGDIPNDIAVLFEGVEVFHDRFTFERKPVIRLRSGESRMTS
jgi:hypothetical protein